MPNTHVTSLDLTQSVRSALAHLYDHAVLQDHPLVSVLELDKNLDRVTRAQEVRRVLLQCIELLKPEGQQNYGQAEAARAYAILTYRYVDGLSMQEIAQKLGLSQRQTYREHKKGVKAVAGLILDKARKGGWDGHALPIGNLDTPGDRLSMAQAEVERLRQEVSAEELDPREVLEGVINTLSPLSQQTSIQVKIVSPGTWPPVVADRIMLRQAFLNLLSRTLTTFVQDDLLITACQEQRGLLINISEKPDVSGTEPAPPPNPKRGQVSLAVARSLIEAQGGELEIEDKGKWRAQILLPVSSSPTILVVDDNVDMVALFKRYVGGRNISVVGTTDGEQALSLAAELQPQIITLDVMMPDQDGWEILQQLKRAPDTKEIPVIICSVLNEPELALSLGAGDIITKPVSQVKLLKVLRRWIKTL